MRPKAELINVFLSGALLVLALRLSLLTSEYQTDKYISKLTSTQPDVLPSRQELEKEVKVLRAQLDSLNSAVAERATEVCCGCLVLCSRRQVHECQARRRKPGRYLELRC